MLHGLALVCLILYFFCSLWLFVATLVQVHLLWKSRLRDKKPVHLPIVNDWPFITIQVPVYNERYVIRRLMDNLGMLDYPKHRFEIQVLDDSTDDSSGIIREAASGLQADGFAVSVLRRKNREGYKAGALQAGLPLCNGSLIAIFDADFTPATDFLKRMAAYFSDERIGGVQGRWEHRNLHENWLTVIQSFLLDSHFMLEQSGRNAAGYYVNFNGTAGMWRKDCIIDSGGWNGAVLTEDLELSYRAQLKGWKMIFDPSISVPADLPAGIDAFKVQQFRWAKGISQAAVCHIGVIKRKRISFAKKLHAMFHLLGSVSFIAILGNLLLALPIIAGRHYSPAFAVSSEFIAITCITLPLICIYYKAGTRISLSPKDFWVHLPVFLVVYMALSAQNSVAVIQGWMGHATPFVRTPKPDLMRQSYDDSTSRSSRFGSIELFVFLYIGLTIVVSFVWHDYFLLPFLIMAFIGLGILLKPSLRASTTTSGSPVTIQPS